ncbi:MAG: ABC transporter ATP-binding protein, partial [SAR324 cluster bacterium]|nr:ABC transporter ATP-binding protein [SAR324 cluster bacterium]
MSAASTSAEANAVEAKNLDLVFQTSDSPIHALSEVNLEIRRGDFICFFGPSGCG